MKGKTKAAIQIAFGRMPGGAKLYRHLTRKTMGTQATHVDKLARVWPDYVWAWERLCGLDLEGKQIWLVEGGYTVFPFLAGYVLTGRGVTVTNCEAQLSDQYTARSVEAVLKGVVPLNGKRSCRLEQIREWAAEGLSAREWVERTGGTYFEGVDLRRLPLAKGSVDVAHSGGFLEHFERAELEEFFQGMADCLRAGGVSSHVVDHRDHLYHADKSMLFLNHLRYSPGTYRFIFGHKLGFHNRMASGDYTGLFEAAGLRKIALRRRALPDLGYLESEDEVLKGLEGIPAELVRGEHRYSDADRHTAAGHYLFRKPEVSVGAEEIGV